MNNALNQLRAQIQECEEFIALCERVKDLEKKQDGRLQQRRANLEAERAETLRQLSMVAGECERLEASLLSKERLMGAFEETQVKGMIDTKRIQIGTLQVAAENATNKIATIDAEMQSTAQQLEALYQQLDEFITVQGFDPNTVGERLAALRRDKESLIAAKKADVSTRTPQSDKAPVERKQSRVEGTPVGEADFYNRLLADLAQAKTSVEIVSPFVDTKRAAKVIEALAGLAANGRNVMVYILPPGEQPAATQPEAQRFIVDAHRLRITVVQRSGIQYNAAIIDNVICWEGNINILGVTQTKETMRRTAASSHVRQLRHFLFNE